MKAPVVIINVQDTAPYFGIVDIGTDPNLSFQGDGCGPVQKIAQQCDIADSESITTHLLQDTNT
jgi:hypothetical protein